MPTSPLLERYREVLESRFVWVLVALGAVVGLFAGGSHGRWTTTWRNSTSFNILTRASASMLGSLPRLSVVAVRPVIRLRGTGLQCDRGRHRSLHDGRVAVQRPAPRRQ